MKRSRGRRILAAASVACLALTPVIGGASTPTGPGADQLARQFSSAALSMGEAELARLQSAQPRTTIMTSPLSIEAALAMLAQGARGATAADMTSGLGFKRQGLTLQDAAVGYDPLRRNLMSSKEVTLSLANGVWVDQRLKLNRAFVQSQQSRFSARITSANFHGGSTVGDINRFVSGATQGQIPTIVESLPHSGVVLVSALYFKGQWADPFDVGGTHNEACTTASGHKIQTPTMHIDSSFSYRETRTFQSVALPYKDPRFELVLVLTKTPGTVLAKGWASSLKSAGYSTREGFVALPRLDLVWSSDLTPSLRAVGLDVALGPHPDYGAMADVPFGPPQVIHKIRLVVDETGTVGAAATAAEDPTTSTPDERTGPPPFRFIANRPFWLLLREKTTGSPIFLGYVAQPKG